MADWLNFAGVKSTDLGVYVQDFPPVSLPEERVTYKPVLGKSGSYTLLDGDAVYEDIVLSANCYVRDLSRLNAISAWLRGRGALILGNTPTYYYDARCVNQIDLKQVVRGHAHRSFTAAFRAKPYRYRYPAIAPYALTKGGTVTNPGNIDAEPTIVIAGSGDIVLTLGAKTIEITGLSGSITIDVALGVAYQTGSNPLIPLTGKVGKGEGNWPFTIPPGTISVNWTGTVTSVTLEPHWRDI